MLLSLLINANIKSVKMKKLFILMIAALSACSSPEKKNDTATAAGFIDDTVIKSTVDSVRHLYPSADIYLIEKGVKHAASLWRPEDGTPAGFSAFAASNYIADPEKRRSVFLKISNYFESLNGYMNEITLDRSPLQIW